MVSKRANAVPPLLAAPLPSFRDGFANLAWDWSEEVPAELEDPSSVCFPHQVSFERSASRDPVLEAPEQGKHGHSQEDSSPSRPLSGNLSKSGYHDSAPSSQFQRTGSASSLDFWSGSRRQSPVGSVVSSMNNSLHGYEVFDVGEQNMASPISAPPSAHDSQSEAEISGFRLPPPPVEFGNQSSFECDICGKTLCIKRKREWR